MGSRKIALMLLGVCGMLFQCGRAMEKTPDWPVCPHCGRKVNPNSGRIKDGATYCSEHYPESRPQNPQPSHQDQAKSSQTAASTSPSRKRKSRSTWQWSSHWTSLNSYGWTDWNRKFQRMLSAAETHEAGEIQVGCWKVDFRRKKATYT